MKHTYLLALLLSSNAIAQTPSGASNAVAGPVQHTNVPFRITDEGKKLPDITWGLDAAWMSEGNVRRGVNFAGADLIEIMRLSFQTTDAVTDGTLTARQKTALNERIRLARFAPKAAINLNSDQEAGVDTWYQSKTSATQAERWSALIAATKAYVEARGLKVISVSPFNEPDYTDWKQGSMADMLAICRMLREDERYAEDFKDVLLCGGNTLNNDKALQWYNFSKKYLDEGNTHQLAGSFDTFANFYKQVAADGKVGVGDELHNTMECMVGSEYGLTKGIWWGTCDHTRSQFMKASRGTRLGYAENRDNWTAAGVYRHPSGAVQGFGGTSERQAYNTTFCFAALDHDVFYNGQGPTREYSMSLPGGTGYQKGQTNAETLVNIQYGADIMPPLPTEPTTYRIVNRATGFALSPESNNALSGKSLKNMTIVQANTAQQWIVKPVDARIGGDFSYYYICNQKFDSLYPDVLNWSLDSGADIILYAGGLGDNEQWFFEYAGDGFFYIRSKHSGLYLEVATGNAYSGGNVQQGAYSGKQLQQWKLLAPDVRYNKVAPAAPTALTAISQPASVRLEWTAPSDRDLRGYNILRSDDGNEWYTINVRIEGTTYIDNTAQPGQSYYYAVQAEDLSQNRSKLSESVTASVSGEPSCIAHISCDSLSDSSVNGNHAALAGTLTTQEGRVGDALSFDGKNNYIQLPATIGNSRELTLSAWVYYRGGSKWQRIFDFGNGTDQYFFLAPDPDNGYSQRIRLAIKNGGNEQILDCKSSISLNKWMHIAVTFGSEAVTIYVNGKVAAQSTSISIRPADFQPIFNYVGRSQFRADPMLKGDVDDIRVYNYCLTSDEVSAIASLSDGVKDIPSSNVSSPEVYTLDGIRTDASQMQSKRIYIVNGKKVSN